MKNIGIISNQAFSLYNFRGNLIKDLVNKGYLVYVFAPDFSKNNITKITDLGAIPISYNMSRTGFNFFKDVYNVFCLYKKISELKLNTIFAYTIKPVIYFIPLSKILGIKNRISMIEGLGYVFMDDHTSNTFKRKVLKNIIEKLYFISFYLSSKVVFLNRDDSNYFIKKKLININKVFHIDGIGVDLQYFNSNSISKSPITFLFIGRLLLEKGIFDFISAAKIINNNFKDIKFLIVGGVDSNPGSLKIDEIQTLQSDDFIYFTGEVENVKEFIEKSSVFVLPSYREGLPRSTIESMAMGRPIITTNVPGCRDTIINELNGYLVDVRNPLNLAEAMKKFILNPELIEVMGSESRKIAQNRFDVVIINKNLIEIIEKNNN